MDYKNDSPCGMIACKGLRELCLTCKDAGAEVAEQEKSAPMTPPNAGVTYTSHTPEIS